MEGEDFTAQVVARVKQLEERRTFRDLATIKKQYRLIRELGEQEHESHTILDKVLNYYRFIHRFFREHLYRNELEEGEREVLHRVVGHCLEELYEGERQVIAGQLARHFSEARELLKAARYALIAAQFERSRYALEVGEQWCESGLKWLDDVSPLHREAVLLLRIELLEESGCICYFIGNFAQADQRFRTALALAQQTSLPAERKANLCERLADVCEMEGHFEEVLQFARQGKAMLPDPHNEVYISLVHDEVFMQMRAGQSEQAIQSFQQMLEEVKELPQTKTLEELRAAIFNTIAIAYGNMGRYAEAIAAYQQAVEVAERVGLRSLKTTLLLNLADEYFKQGHLNQSQVYLDMALNLAVQIGDLDDVAYAQASHGAILLELNQPESAIREIEQAIVQFEHLGSTWNMPYMYADMAVAYLMLSDFDTAYARAQQSLNYAQETDSQYETGIALTALARVEAAQGKWKVAEKHFKRAIQIHRRVGINTMKGVRNEISPRRSGNMEKK